MEPSRYLSPVHTTEVRMRQAIAIIFALATAPLAAEEPERVVAYRIVDAREIPESLTGAPGDAEAGRKLYYDLKATGCSGCHGSPGGPGAQTDAGAVDAPKLDRVAARMPEGTIRLWLVAPQVLRPGTTMPGYYSVGQRTDPNDPRYGETRLSAAEIEDIVAYLLSGTRAR